MDDIDQEESLFDEIMPDKADKVTNDPWSPMNHDIKEVPLLLPAPSDPLRNIKSSENYIQSLEKKLNKVKGISSAVKPSEMIKSLQAARDLQTSQYLSSSACQEESSDNIAANYETASAMTAFQRKLNPEKQAINPLELVPLVHEDILAKLSEEEQPSESGKIT